MSRPSRAPAAESATLPGDRLAPPTDILAAIARAAAALEVEPAPSRRRSGWPSGASYVWRFSALPFSKSVTARRERP